MPIVERTDVYALSFVDHNGGNFLQLLKNVAKSETESKVLVRGTLQCGAPQTLLTGIVCIFKTKSPRTNLQTNYEPR